MRSVILMCSPAKRMVLLAGLLVSLTGLSQVNSPYSRFGVGDLYTSRNVMSKSMGGLATPVNDIQSINFINPASYTAIGFVTFDVGMEAEFRTLLNQAKTNKFESANMIFNYAVLGVPLMKSKDKTKTYWAMAFGIRPVSRIRYDIQSSSRLSGIDSVRDEFRGDGGLYRGFWGTGAKLGNLSLGVNLGFVFGNQNNATIRSVINDSVPHYSASFAQNTSINKFMADAGLQYDLKLSPKSLLRFGANGYLGGDANAQRERISQTVFFNQFGQPDSIDVVLRDRINGAYSLPSGYSFGLLFEARNKLMIGAEYETSAWSSFKNFGQSGGLSDVSVFRVGAQIIPDMQSTRNYLKQIAYRAGFFAGKDYVNVNGSQLPVWGVTFGGGIPIRRFNAYSTQFNTINFSFEYGRRGNAQSPYVERYYRINFGLALSDVWFIKRQYD